MNPWEFFETILYISLPEREDKRAQLLQEFYVQNVPYFKLIDGVRHENPVLGFNKAQHNALQAAKGNTAIFEDDVVFIPKDDWFRSTLLQALDELPEDWDILYLGANVVGTDLCNWPEPEVYSSHLRRVTQAWTTHAVCYSQKGRDWVLTNWDYENGQIYDDFLRCNLEKLQAFIIFPMVANQREGFSDIWNRDVDYGFFNVWRQNR